MKKIWFITGISSGLGKAMAEAVMAQGGFVVGTSRSEEQVDAFNLRHAETGLAVRMDITKKQDVDRVVYFVTKTWGRIDFLVNNAGIGFVGAVEETSDAETRQIFEANFFGALALTRSFLPLFRKQGSGHIFQISSHGGFKAFAGFGIYNASKFALEGFSEALSHELAPLGIKLTIVQPGPFRTNFAGDSLGLAREKISDYDNTAGLFRERIQGVHGKQEGDPAKAAQAILQVAAEKNPPFRLPLGKIAIQSILSKIEMVNEDLEAYRSLAESAVF